MELCEEAQQKEGEEEHEAREEAKQDAEHRGPLEVLATSLNDSCDLACSPLAHRLSPHLRATAGSLHTGER